MEQNEYIMTVTTMEYASRESGKQRLGQVIQLGVLQAHVDASALHGYTALPTGTQATYRDQAMAIEHGDLALEVRQEDIPLVIPHFGPHALKGFGEPLKLNDASLHPWPDSIPLFFRELVYGAETIRRWFHDRGGIYPSIHQRLMDALLVAA